MFTDYPNRESATQRALSLAESRQYPILVMRVSHGLYRIGSRCEPNFLACGLHIATVHASGLVEPCQLDYHTETLNYYCLCMTGGN